jgi:polysaccharide pyruvyl transferase CsaB
VPIGPRSDASAPGRRRVVVAGWSGTTNLGDELLLRQLIMLLDDLHCDATVVSGDPAATTALHGVDALALGDVVGLWRAIKQSKGLVLGPGTLLQDQTSPVSLPWHLSRVATAVAAGRPVAAVGLGVGPLRRTGSRSLTGAALRRCTGVAVRDNASAALLAACGVRGVRTGCDLVLAMDPPTTAIHPRIAVCLRAHHPAGSKLPLRRHHAPAWDPARIAGLAAGLDDAARRTGLPLHLVAMDTDADARFHQLVADHLHTEHTLEVPTLDTVVDAVATSELVIAMRYHAGVAALVGGRPMVLIGYTDKVDALATDIMGAARTHPTSDADDHRGTAAMVSPPSTSDPGVVRVPDTPDGWAQLGTAAMTVRGSATMVATARQRLAVGIAAHRGVLTDLLGPR